MIHQFQGQYRFLSNFHPVEVHYAGHPFPSVENAYQYSKSRLHLGEFQCATAGQARRMGRRFPLRADFESEKLDTMYALVLEKFTRHHELAVRLKATGDSVLVEGNTWGDRFWGICNGTGENHLGRILMRVRWQLG